MRRIRQAAAVLVAALAFGAACGGGSSTPAQSSDTLTQTVTVRSIKQPLAYYGPVFAAADNGFGKQNHLDIQLVSLQAGSQDAPALVNGTLDIGSCTFDNIANLKEQGKNIIAVYQLLNRVTLDLVVANKVLAGKSVTPTSPLADRYKVLKGLKFGISTPGSPSETFLKVMLKDAGLNPDKDVQLVRVGSIAGLFAALKSGQIDGYILSPPSPQQAEQAGVGTIFIRNTKGEVPSLAKFLYVDICTSTDYANKNPAVVKAFVKSIQQANDWMRTHPDELYKTFQKEFPEVDPTTWSTGFPNLLPATSTNGKFDEASVKQTYQLFKDYGVINTIPDTKEGVTWTNKYLPAKA
jgi:NitT/TauT family transport system substrate-binding protein